MIGVLPSTDKVAELKPLSDRVLIKVGAPEVQRRSQELAGR